MAETSIGLIWAAMMQLARCCRVLQFNLADAPVFRGIESNQIKLTGEQIGKLGSLPTGRDLPVVASALCFFAR